MEDRIITQKHTHTGEIQVKFIPPVRWWNRAKWELLTDYTSHNGNVVVPSGFVTDGATIAWFLRWLFSPTGRYFGAAIIHDYIIVKHDDWESANTEFEEEMHHLGVETWMKTVMVAAVKAWDWWKSKL